VTPPRRTARAAARPEAATEHQLAEALWDALLDKRATDVVWLDVREVTDLADSFIIATMSNTRQGSAIVDACEQARKELGFRRLGIEGMEGAGSSWVVLDYGDVIVHLLMPEQREYYALEHLWADARVVQRSAG